MSSFFTILIESDIIRQIHETIVLTEISPKSVKIPLKSFRKFFGLKVSKHELLKILEEKYVTDV